MRLELIQEDGGSNLAGDLSPQNLDMEVKTTMEMVVEVVTLEEQEEGEEEGEDYYQYYCPGGNGFGSVT